MATSADELSVPATQPKVVSLIDGFVIGVFGLGLGTALSLVALFALVSVGYDLSVTALLVIALVFTQGIGCGGVAIAYVKYRHVVVEWLRARFGDRSWLAPSSLTIPASIPSLRDLLLIGGGYVGAFLAAIVGALTLTAAGIEGGTNQAAELGLENPELLLLLIPASILLIGPGEELLFRGVVQGRIRESFGPVSGILLASAIFAGVHYFAITGGTGARLASVSVLLLPSVVFGTIYELSDNIVVPAFVHGIYNATLFAGLYAMTQLDELPDTMVFLLDGVTALF
ncbi:MAG: CPBP family intramembrane glutamic endopeptidase [Halobacteriota archaeon]